MEEKMYNMELNANQYETLLKLIAFGGWMAQGGEMGSDDTVEDLQQLVLSYARDFGKNDKVEYDEEIEAFALEANMNEQFTALISEYEEESFWDQLIFRMANRDAVVEMEKNSLSEEEAYVKFEEYVEQYEEEFDNHGLDHLMLSE